MNKQEFIAKLKEKTNHYGRHWCWCDNCLGYICEDNLSIIYDMVEEIFEENVIVAEKAPTQNLPSSNKKVGCRRAFNPWGKTSKEGFEETAWFCGHEWNGKPLLCHECNSSADCVKK